MAMGKNPAVVTHGDLLITELLLPGLRTLMTIRNGCG
jgi:hypothetical protein